ncbi:NAD-binding protein, partial [Actinomycetota bacterium]
MSIEASGWSVKLVDRDDGQVRRAAEEGLSSIHVTDLRPATLDGFIDASVDAVVAMSGSDTDDLTVCTHAVDAHGIQRAVIRLDDLSLADRGVLIVDHSSAMVNLLEQAVRAPQSLGLILHNDPNWEAVQITVTNPDAVGREIRQLRLPQDVLVVAIVRS